MAKSAGLSCPNCGAKLDQFGDSDQAGCAHCGAQLLTEPKAVNPSAEAAPPLCPRCGKADRIQKVSTTYVAETSQSHSAGLWRHGDTELSRLLSPPPKPRLTDLSALSLFNLGIMLCGLGLYSGICFFGGEPLRVGPSEILFVGVSLGARSALTYVAFILGAGIVVGTPLTLGAALIHLGRKRLRSWRERLPFEKGRWERALDRWEGLYFCQRCQGVFTPGEEHFVLIQRMKEYLYGD